MGSLQNFTGRMTRSSGKRNATLDESASDEEMDDVDSNAKDTRSSKKRGFGGLGLGFGK